MPTGGSVTIRTRNVEIDSTSTTAGFLLLRLTVPEVRRLLRAFVGQKVPSPIALYWSKWRR